MLMETKYSAIFTGQLKPGSDQEAVIRKMVEITRSTEDKIRPIFAHGKPVVIKKGLAREAAEKYVRVLDNIGMEMKLSQSQPKQPVTAETAEKARPAVKAPPQPQKERRESGPRPSGPDPNPYAAPKADLAVEPQGIGTFLDDPRKVSAGRGFGWIMDGFRLFFSETWKWIGITLVFFVILIPLSLVPFIGDLLNQFISIILVGGALIGAHSLAGGNGLRFGHLFSGFTQNRNQLLLLGLYYLLGIILITIIALLPLAGTMISLFLSGGFDDPEIMGNIMTEKIGFFFLCMGIGLLLSIPFMMSVWFAPALIAVAGRSCMAAVKESFKGVLRNWLPFLVYGIGLMVVGLAMFAVMTGLMGVTALAGMGDGASFLMFLIPFLLFIILALPLSIGFGLSVYTGFRDIFYKA